MVFDIKMSNLNVSGFSTNPSPDTASVEAVSVLGEHIGISLGLDHVQLSDDISNAMLTNGWLREEDIPKEEPVILGATKYLLGEEAVAANAEASERVKSKKADERLQEDVMIPAEDVFEAVIRRFTGYLSWEQIHAERDRLRQVMEHAATSEAGDDFFEQRDRFEAFNDAVTWHFAQPTIGSGLATTLADDGHLHNFADATHVARRLDLDYGFDWSVSDDDFLKRVGLFKKVSQWRVERQLSPPTKSYSRFTTRYGDNACECGLQVSAEVKQPQYAWFAAAQNMRIGLCDCGVKIAFCNRCAGERMCCRKCHAVKYGIDEAKKVQVDFIAPAVEARPPRDGGLVPNPNHSRSSARSVRRALATVQEHEQLIDRRGYGESDDDVIARKVARERERRAEHQRKGFDRRVAETKRKIAGKQRRTRKDREFFNSFGKLNLENATSDFLKFLESFACILVLFRGIPSDKRKWWHWVAFLDLIAIAVTTHGFGDGAFVGSAWFMDWIKEDEDLEADACLAFDDGTSLLMRAGKIMRVFQKGDDPCTSETYGAPEAIDRLRNAAVKDSWLRAAPKFCSLCGEHHSAAVDCDDNTVDPVSAKCLLCGGMHSLLDECPKDVSKAPPAPATNIVNGQNAAETLLKLMSSTGLRSSRAGKKLSTLLGAAPYIPFVIAVGGDKERFVEWFSKRVANPSAILGSMAFFCEIMFEVITSVIPWMITGNDYYLYPEKAWQLWFQSTNDFLLDVKSDKLIDMVHSEQVRDKTLEYVDGLLKTTASLQQRFASEKEGVLLKETTMMIQRLQAAKREVAAEYVRRHAREEPLVLFLRSDPGQGKTIIANMLIAKVSHMRQWAANDVFTVLKGKWPWEKYRGQNTVVIDEGGAIQAIREADMIPGMLLDGVGTAPVETLQAFEKGEHPLVSKLFIIMSNLWDLGVNAMLTTPKAIARRLKYMIEPTVNPEFQNPADGSLKNGVNVGRDLKKIWSFSVSFASTATTSERFKWLPHVWDVPAGLVEQVGSARIELTKVNYDVFMLWLEWDITQRIEHNERVFAESKNPANKLWCKEHQQVLSYCHDNGLACSAPGLHRSYKPEIPKEMKSWREVYRNMFVKAEGQCGSRRIQNYVADMLEHPPVQTAVANIVSSTIADTAANLQTKIEDGSLFRKGLEAVASYASALWDKIPWLKLFFCGLGAVGAYKLISLAMRGLAKEMNLESATDDLAAQVPQPRPDIPKKDYFWAPSVQALRSKGAQLSEIDKFRRVLVNNLRLFGDRKTGKMFTALALGGNLNVTNRHNFAYTATPERLELMLGDYELIVEASAVYMPPDSDLCYFLANCPLSPDLTKFFGEEVTSANVPLDLTAFYLANGREFHTETVVAVGVEKFSIAVEGKMTMTTKGVACKGEYVSLPGDCGSPYVRMHPSERPLILGIHCGSQDRDGVQLKFFVPLTKEMVERARAELGPLLSLECELPLSGELVDLHPKSIFQWAPEVHPMIIGSEKVGAVPKLESNLVRTDFSPEVTGPILKVAPIFKTIKVDGRHVNSFVQKMTDVCRATRDHDRELYNMAAEEFFYSQRHLPISELSPLTVAEAIAGTPGQIYSKAMPKKTSAGWPPGKKEQYMGPNGELLAPSAEELVKMLDVWKEQIRYGMKFKASLKDEPITQKKLEAGKVRAFVVAPLHYVVVCKMVLAPIFGLMRADKGSEACIGMNVYGPDYAAFVERVLWKEHPGVKITDMDFAGWDLQTLVAILIRAMMKWLEPSGYLDKVITYGEGRSITVREVFNGILAEESWKHFECCLVHFIVPSVMGSGVYGTAELNTLIVAMLLRAMFLVCFLNRGEVRVPSREQLRAFERKIAFGDKDWFTAWVRACIYGDDNTQSVRPQAQEFYNPTRMVEAARLLGFTLTDSRKSGEARWKDISEVLFLKRFLVWYEGRAFAGLDADSIQNSIQWRDKKSPLTPPQMHAVLLANARREYFYHGREVFDEKDKLYTEEVKRLGLQHLIAPMWWSWDELLAAFDANVIPEDLGVEL